MIDALLSQDPVLYLSLALWGLLMLVAASLDWFAVRAAEIDPLPTAVDTTLPADDTDEVQAA